MVKIMMKLTHRYHTVGILSQVSKMPHVPWGHRDPIIFLPVWLRIVHSDFCNLFKRLHPVWSFRSPQKRLVRPPSDSSSVVSASYWHRPRWSSLIGTRSSFRFCCSSIICLFYFFENAEDIGIYTIATCVELTYIIWLHGIPCTYS